MRNDKAMTAEELRRWFDEDDKHTKEDLAIIKILKEMGLGEEDLEIWHLFG